MIPAGTRRTPTDNPFALVVGLIVVVAVGIAVYYLYNLAQPTVTRKARVVAKRSALRHVADGNPQTSYHCTFEFEDGRRVEYTVGSGPYALLAEGDEGELDTKGALFWDFRRRLG